jgi:tol-pal system protein YbgF
MKNVLFIAIVFSITAMAGNVFAQADDARIQTLEGRIQALEATNLARGTNIASAVSRSEAVQTEFAAVKGAVDSNSHRITSLNGQLQSLYRELEQRVQAMEDQLRLIQGMLRKDLSQSTSKAAAEYLAYQDGAEAMTATHYMKAAAAFQGFVDRFPKSKLVPEAQYKMAQCYFLARDYQQSIKQFQVFIERNSRSKKVADAMVMQGSAFVELGMIEEAKAFFTKVGQDYPKSKAAKQAKAKIQLIDSRGTMTAQNHAGGQPGGAAIEYPSETVQQQRAREKATMERRAQPAPFTAPAPATPQKAPKKDRNYMEF